MSNAMKSIWPALGVVLLVGWYSVLPFERIPTLEYHGFTLKVSYFIGVLLSLWGVLNLNWLRRIKLSLSDKFLVLFGLIATLSTLAGYVEPRNAIVLALWWLMIALYLLSSRMDLYRIVANAILLATFAVSIFGLYQFIGDSLGLAPSLTGLRDEYTRHVLGFPRIQSVALEPLYFSNFLLVPLFLALKRSGEAKTFWNKYWWLSVLLLINIILGQSRGAYLGLGASLIILVAHLIMRGGKQHLARLALTVIAAMIISAGLVTLNGRKTLTDSFKEHAFAQDATNQGSVGGRVDGYRQAFEYFKEKPLLGWGPGSFGTLAKTDNSPNYQIANNIYLEVLAETGILGLIAFFGFLLLLTIESWRAYRAGSDATRRTILYLGLGLVAVFIQYNFFSTLYIIYIWAFLALLRSQFDNSKSVILKPKA